MSSDELVLRLSAAMVIIFEFIEVIDDRVPAASAHFTEALTHLGNAVDAVCVEEMKETGRIIPRPILEREVAFNEDTFYVDLSRLEKTLKEIADEWNDPNSYWVGRSAESLAEGVYAVLVTERRLLAQDMVKMNPWSALNATPE